MINDIRGVSLPKQKRQFCASQGYKSAARASTTNTLTGGNPCFQLPTPPSTKQQRSSVHVVLDFIFLFLLLLVLVLVLFLATVLDLFALVHDSEPLVHLQVNLPHSIQTFLVAVCLLDPLENFAVVGNGSWLGLLSLLPASVWAPSTIHFDELGQEKRGVSFTTKKV